MSLSTATITFDISDHVGTDYDRRRGIRGWVDTNIPDDTVIDTGGNKIRLGSGKVTFNDDGTGSFTVWIPGTGSNPESWQTYFHVEYVDSGNPKTGRQVRTFGPFTITGNADLADLVAQIPMPPDMPTAISLSSADARYIAQADSLINAKARGVDASGTTGTQDDLLALVQEAIDANNLGFCSQGVYVPPGIYRLTAPLDFGDLVIPGGTPPHLDGFSFICDPSTTFYVDFDNGDAVNLGLPTGYEFRGAQIELGIIYDNVNNPNVNGLRVRSVNNSRITAMEIRGMSGSGVVLDPTPTIGVFNNYIDVRTLRDNYFGFATLGYTLPNVIGAQGNEIHLGQVSSCEIGVNVDANGVGRSSQWNHFTITALEDCVTAGIVDSCGQNTYNILSAASIVAPTLGDFVLTTGALFAPLVIGRLSFDVNLNGGRGTIINMDDQFSDVVINPGTGTTFTNTTVKDVTGMSTTIHSPGAYAVYEVTATLDLASTGGAAIFIGELMIGATAKARQMIAQMPTNGQRQPVTVSWTVTGLAKGDHTTKLRGSLTSAGSYTAASGHSEFRVRRVS